MLERQSANQLDKLAEQAKDSMTPGIKKSITSATIWSVVVSLIPLFGLETIIYVFILWNMYHSIAKKAGFPFRATAIMTGFIINIMISLVVGGIAGFLVGLGEIVQAVIVGVATYQSGVSYLGSLSSHYNK